MTRKRLSPTIEGEVLVRCRRRCCICFGLNRDIGIKPGQIAHLDQDSSNDSLENLAFLCFEHHDQYDSTTRQSKNFTLIEVTSYRDELHRSVIPVLETRTYSQGPARPARQQDGTVEYEARRKNEQKTALVELLSRRDSVSALSFLCHELRLTADTTQRLLFELAAEGAVRIDRQKGSLKKTYSLAASLENRLLDTFVASLGEDLVADTRHIRRRGVMLDAVVETRSTTYAVETLVPRDGISKDLVKRRMRDLDSARRQLMLRGATNVLLIGIADTTVVADADLKHLEEDKGVLVKYIELGGSA